METVYQKVKQFKKKYPRTVAFRLKRHSKVVQSFINPDEKLTFAFAAQKNENNYALFNTCVVAITNKRLLIGQKRVTWGYDFKSITPDLYNDLQVSMRILWGIITIDTIKERVYLANIQKSSLDEIETAITTFMMAEKKKMGFKPPKN